MRCIRLEPDDADKHADLRPGRLITIPDPDLRPHRSMYHLSRNRAREAAVAPFTAVPGRVRVLRLGLPPALERERVLADREIDRVGRHPGQRNGHDHAVFAEPQVTGGNCWAPAVPTPESRRFISLCMRRISRNGS